MSGNKYICGSGDFTTEWRYARKPQAVIKEPEDTPPIPNKGDLVAVRDYAGDAWTIRVFSHMEGNRYVCFRWYAIRNSYCNNNTSDWEECVPLCLCKAITSKLVGDKQ